VGQRKHLRGRGLNIFLQKKEMKSSIMNRYFVCHRIASAVKEVEFVTCDTDQHLVVTKFSKRLSVSK
jgi:hypothetical protein